MIPLLVLLALSAATCRAQIDEMHRGIRDYLLRLPVLQGTLKPHPQLLPIDRCDPADAREVVIVLSYRALDCAAYPGARVLAPRLIDPAKRERIRRMAFPFAMAPLGFELAAYNEARKTAKLPVRLVTNFVPQDTPRMEENAFGIPIGRHDESRIERSTTDLTGIERYLLGLIPEAEAFRERQFRRLGARRTAALWHKDVVGALPPYRGPLNVREKLLRETPQYTATSIVFDALPGVIGQGVLLRPSGMKPGEKRDLIVAQHGLMGRPESLFGQPEDTQEYRTYRNFAERLVAEGFLVYCPQNPYSGDFRPLQLLANPRGLSLFSFIEAQYSRMLDYLESRPDVDGIAYYGLSYGGATALRVPVFDSRFRAIVCGGNFNEWIRKLILPELKYSYLHTREYEIFEWGMAWVASHAELAAMTAAPFLVERGHRDPVGEDHWVEYEFARLKRYSPTAQIAFFDGEHRTDGAAAIPFFKQALQKRIDRDTRPSKPARSH